MAENTAMLLVAMSLLSLSSCVEDGRIYVNATGWAAEVPRLHPEEGRPMINQQVGQMATGRRLAIPPPMMQAILDKHNELRSAVSFPCTAADMETLSWDESLAVAATNYAAGCVWGHDAVNNRANKWGENLAMQWSSLGNSYDTNLLTGMVQSWYDEIVDTNWNESTGHLSSWMYAKPEKQCKSFEGGTGQCMIGHYTQVIWAATNKIGCGVASCNRGLGGQGGVYLVCKYTPPGNLAIGRAPGSPLTSPYLLGRTCAACSGSCSGGLCSANSPRRCEDAIARETMVFNGIPYHHCNSLISGTKVFGSNFWCSRREDKFHICELTCGRCSIPFGVGAQFCAQAEPLQAISQAEAIHVTDLAWKQSLGNASSFALVAALSVAAVMAVAVRVRSSVANFSSYAEGDSLQPMMSSDTAESGLALDSAEDA